MVLKLVPKPSAYALQPYSDHNMPHGFGTLPAVATGTVTATSITLGPTGRRGERGHMCTHLDARLELVACFAQMPVDTYKETPC